MRLNNQTLEAAAWPNPHSMGRRLSPLPLDDSLRAMDNVLVTPHTAASTNQTLGEVRRTTMDDVVRVLSGVAPVHPVEKESRHAH
jgi:phosphoglycerate dehydrogenase-like enzyme